MTDAEVDAAIEAAYADARNKKPKNCYGQRTFDPFITGKELWRVIYRAGLAAGRARAIEECAKLCDLYALADSANDATSQGNHTPTDCATAIRALKEK